ncbi:EpsG family protein [uncultured Dysgonomonas sp.]|uniref:Putative polysaccharide polymerase n=1 Tax=uncultured Dysgonomonas sp. TaxID=206096 RepID=A0A212J8H9_9BACT|nr:EpsG family protein [uncultured Dysgonomonas sp.]SBV95748.1 putative polysaccharide polymerase [uncultured Dysgonomonas sp.]
MLIYILLYTLLFLSICKEKENVDSYTKKKILFFFVVIFTLFRGLRWETGTDWELYYETFKSADWNNIFSYTHSVAVMEPGYMFINALVRNLGGNYTVFLLLTNLFILVVYMKFAQTNSKTPIYVFVLIMFSTQFFPVRMGIAVAFIMMGLCSFSDRKYMRIIICTLLAVSIHKSALVFIPVYFLIFFRSIPTMLAVTISLAALIIAQLNKVQELLMPLSLYVDILGGENVATKYEHYFEYDIAAKGGESFVKGASTFFNSIIFIITLIPFGKMAKDLSKKEGEINYGFIYNIYFVFVIIGILFSSDEMLGLKRMQNYFMFAFPVLFSAFIVYGREKYPKYKFAFPYIFTFYILFRSYTLFFSGYLEMYFPYYSIFNDNFYRPY